MARDDLHFRLRIPEDLKSKVEASALANKRSMTAEIVARLEASMNDSIVADTKVFQLLQESIELSKKQNAMIAEMMERLPDAGD